MPWVWGGVEIQVMDPKTRRRSPLCKTTSTPGFLVNKHQSFPSIEEKNPSSLTILVPLMLFSICTFCIIPFVLSWGHLRNLRKCKSPLNLLLNCLIRNLLKILLTPFCLQIVHLFFCLLVAETQVPWCRHVHHSVHAQETKLSPELLDQICVLTVYIICGCLWAEQYPLHLHSSVMLEIYVMFAVL